MGCALCGGCQCQCDWYSHLCFRSPPRQEVESQIKEADSTKSAKDAQPKEELGNRQSPKILVHSLLVLPQKYLTCE